MRGSHTAASTLTLLTLLTVTLLTVPTGLAAPAAAEPAVAVTPSTGLGGGDTVTVTAGGLPPGTEVQVVPCDQVTDATDTCLAVATVTPDATGRIATSVTLSDPVYHGHEFGDATPVYCRADVCRIFLTWVDAYGELKAVASEPLEFTGSPATIDASRTTGLHRTQRVRVNGTAFGAEGRTVIVLEQACFAIVQASGCYGTTVVGTGTVRPDGTYALRVRVTRYLADGTDCADPDILGSCRLTAQILDATGQPDDSFGVSALGDPGVVLTFRG